MGADTDPIQEEEDDEESKRSIFGDQLRAFFRYSSLF